MKKQSVVIIVLALGLMLGCAKDYREAIKAPEAKFYQRQELEAARMLIPMINKPGRDQLLFMMEAGYLLHMGGRYEDSNKVLLKAAQLAPVKPISVSQQVGSIFSNDRVTNYRGEDFEKVLIHMFLGINFLMLKQYESAAVEFKAVNLELMKIKSETGTALYKQNIMAKYLTAIAHEIRADLEDSAENREYAIVEYRQILQLDPNNQMARRDMMMAQQKNTALGELVVIFQAGRGPIKLSRGKLLDDISMNHSVTTSLNSTSLVAGLSMAAVMASIATAENPLPKYIRRSNKTSHLRISVMGADATTTILENVEYTAIKNFDDGYSRLQAKVAASIVVKAVTSLAAGIAAQETARQLSKGNSMLASLAGLAVGSGTAAGLFATMRPDLRCWHTLPANFQLARMRLRPGLYTIAIQYIGHNGAVLESTQVNVEIKKKEKHFINLRTVE